MSAIETTGLTKYYGDTLGIEDLSLSVREGEVFGFLGPNGAGKTTAIRTLLGFISPTDGTATVLGRDATDEAELIEAKRRVGYLPSNPGFDEGVTGRRLIRYHAALKSDERSDELLDLFDPPVEREIGEYSTGNRQKLALVLTFMHDPDLVVMDEPTSGLDPLMQERLYEFVDEECDRGTTFFFSSHVLSEVRRICDRVGIIRDGRLVTVEGVEELLDRSGKRVRVGVEGWLDPAEFDLPGVHDLDVDSERGDASFMFTGEYDDLLDHLRAYSVRDLDVEEAPLEDVFMKFYDGEAASESDDTDPATGTPPKASSTGGENDA
ncbi:ABC transporter ATP-binding protein [Halorussus litoreus]|uniref:ABC transporter ATP-binding protein n=1 Tax=Halorussus litoreus TaxID=1710536 RepID=UPI000E247CAB|nr:ABC transporter ATP-binding protein [Halorussus litoreus]